MEQWSEVSANHHGGTVMEPQQLHHSSSSHSQTTIVTHHHPHQDPQSTQHQQDYAYDAPTTTDGLHHAAAAMDYAAVYGMSGTASTHNNNNTTGTAPAGDPPGINATGTGSDPSQTYHPLHQSTQPQQQQQPLEQPPPETTTIANPQYTTLENGTTYAGTTAATTAPTTTPTTAEDPPNPPSTATRKNPRSCKFPGCFRIAKSGGHCQAHGAKAKRCSVEGCDKQAQTTHEGMCKRHWKLKNFPEDPQQQQQNQQPTPESPVESHLKSVYETVLPQSIAFRPMAAAKAKEAQETSSTASSHHHQPQYEPPLPQGANFDPLDPPPAPEGATVMPLVSFFQEGASKPFGWHRNEERQARGLKPIIDNFAMQLEDWERQLAVVETLLLGGGTPYANFQNLAHGWGRKKGFHSALINTVCENRRDIIRKRKVEFIEQQQRQQSADDEEDDDDDDEEEEEGSGGENEAKRQVTETAGEKPSGQYG